MAKTAFNGNPVSLAGEFVQIGAQAPEFSLVKGDLGNYTLADAHGKYVVLNIFPSMDTGVCAASVRNFRIFRACPCFLCRFFGYVSSLFCKLRFFCRFLSRRN